MVLVDHLLVGLIIICCIIALVHVVVLGLVLCLDDYKDVLDGAPEALGVERPTGAVDERADSVLLGLGVDLLVEALEPAGAEGRLAVREELRVQDLAEVEAGLDRGEDLGVRVQLADDAADAVDLVPGHEVALVDDQDVGELDLVDLQVRDVAVVLGGHVRLPVDEEVGRLEVPHEVDRVDDGDARVQPGHLGQAAGLEDLGEALVALFAVLCCLGVEVMTGCDVHLGESVHGLSIKLLIFCMLGLG